MTDQQLLDYIKRRLQQGVSKEEIKNTLLSQGLREKNIDEAFYSASSSANQLEQLSESSNQTISSLSSASAILNQAWFIYKQRFSVFLCITIIPILITIALVIILIVNADLPVILWILFFVVIFISQFWGQIALIYAIKDRQENIGVMESYRRSWHKILSYWWMSLLAGFITIGGFMFLIVPGIIFSIWFSLASFVLVAEDLKGMNALLKSREYVKGRWFSVFWRFLFIVSIFLILSLIPSFIFALLKIAFVGGAVRFLIGLFLTPLVTIYSFLIYSGLKTLKGEFSFEPTSGKKASFILVGILGFFIPFFLAVFLSLNIAESKSHARDTMRRVHLEQIQSGLEWYYDEYNIYPSSLNKLSPDYLPIVPVDPKTGKTYQYQLQQGGRNYKICAQLEKEEQKCLTSLYFEVKNH